MISLIGKDITSGYGGVDIINNINLISWLVFPHIFITLVTITIKCDNPQFTVGYRAIIFFIKFLLLLALLQLPIKFSALKKCCNFIVLLDSNC